MFRRCVMSQVRRLTTASSREYQTNFKTYLNHTPPQPLTTYRSHMISPPLAPFNQMLVFRSLSTATPQDAKGSEPSSDSSSSAETTLQSFDELMKSIYDNPLMGFIGFIGIIATLRFAFIIGRMMKKKYNHKKHIKRDERIEDGYLKYHITGFTGACEEYITVEIRNSQLLVVSGLILKSNGKSEVIECHITLPNNDYSEANKKATFHSDAGFLVVEISDFKKPQDIKVEVKETKG